MPEYNTAGSEELFNKFKQLEFRLGMLSAIVQNPLKIKHEELVQFKKDMDELSLRFIILKDDVMDFVTESPQ
ncbi:hypothetical protein EVB97_252 [Rhizobium phage RHph_Y65]|uniref:Uncharacterized protein n=1 Tax=Rhizobium phage RHph_Y65 TaxID=2509785 RepID=A0A7S5UW06_9CAUD|nr:hypothetical protein PQC17_gp252 [Rhizobium phage RHph_Y65]QIG72810.1 hypothetical protein EVB97_252 [Rhizobium phage RHph_Y65]